MTDTVDPYAAFASPALTSTSTSSADPYAAFASPAEALSSDEHVLTIHGKTAPAPDLGAQSAAQQGFVSGIPILGPLIGKAEDAIGSRIGAAISGQTPAQVSANAQTITDTTSAAHPVASTLGGIAGAIAGTAPVVAAAPGLFGASAGPLTVAKVLAGAGSGSLVGGTDAALRSNADPGSTAEGAISGAALGAAGPVVGATLGRIGTAVADWNAQRGALNNIGVSRPAADILTRAAEADGSLGGQGAVNIAAAGPDAMLADAGPGVQNVLDTALQRGGPGAVAARQAVEQRAGAADTNLTNALDTALGRPQGIQTTTNDIRSGTAAARSDAYNNAYATPIDYSTPEGQQLEQIVRQRVPPGIIARANNQMRLDGHVSQQILANVADDGGVTYERLPDVRQLDYITRSLNDVAKSGDGKGALGGNTWEGRSFGNVSKDIRDNLKQAVPAYDNALQVAGQTINERNALKFGATLLSPNVPRDVAAQTIEDMTQPELRQARQGLRSQMSEVLANVKRTVTDPNIDARQAMDVVKQLSSDAAQTKVGLLVSAKEQQALNEALVRATRALELRAALTTNSKTAARLITNDTIKKASEPGSVGKFLSGEPLQAGKSVAQFVTGNRPVDIQGREDQIYGELARHLTNLRGNDAVDFLNQLSQAHATRAAANSKARNLPYGPAVQTGLLSLLPHINNTTK